MLHNPASTTVSSAVIKGTPKTPPGAPEGSPGRGPSLPGLHPLEELAAGLGISPRPPGRRVVLIIHGTYANPSSRQPVPLGSDVSWWKPYGSFAKALDAALERHGSRARCGADVDELLLRRLDSPVVQRDPPPRVRSVRGSPGV